MRPLWYFMTVKTQCLKQIEINVGGICWQLYESCHPHDYNAVTPPRCETCLILFHSKRWPVGRNGTAHKSACSDLILMGRQKLYGWRKTNGQCYLLTILHGWLWGASWAWAGIPFWEFELVVAKLWHAFTAIPVGKWLLSPCNWIMQVTPTVVYLHKNMALQEAILDARTLLRESTILPTRCLGMDPYLQRVRYVTRVWLLTGFAARVQQGFFTEGESVCRLQQSLAQLLTLARWSPWPGTATQQN